MPMHDWKKVDAGIYHAFHHDWITAIGQALNAGLLPEDYYALPEQIAASFGPDVLTLQTKPLSSSTGEQVTTQPRPATRFTAESATEFYRRKKSSVVVRHVPWWPTRRDGPPRPRFFSPSPVVSSYPWWAK